MARSLPRLAACILIACFRLGAQVEDGSTFTTTDRAAIKETYHLWHSQADGIWPGSAAISSPLIYVKQSVEYAIGFPKPLQGFTKVALHSDSSLSLQLRSRTFPPDIAASFPVEGVAAVIIGTPAQLHQSIEAWVITAEHEVFHVYQWANGSGEKIAALHIAPAEQATSWQLTFPFPYHDKNVTRLAHLQGYPLWLACNDKAREDALYDVGTSLDAVHVYKSVLDGLDRKDYLYSKFQEWNEGVAKYTEYRFAEHAAQTGYSPDPAFQSLPAYKGYANLWTAIYRDLPFLVKHTGRAAQDRNMFYHLGLGKALALDRVDPGWKSRYFLPEVWLDDLLASSIERGATAKSLTPARER